ncbi:hypothetical protein ACFOLC_15925 [Lysobacter cavernae]|uniref:Uncharacterized protein n=1 Tax=Lysobacter cavernae TaxID=1685901 RepID=A0ABV7RWE0_9GAMM
MSSETIEEVRSLFELAERETDPERKFTALEEALDLTDDLRGDPAVDPAVLGVANNLRQSHLRRLLGQLVAMHHVEMDTWFNYIKLLLLRVVPEVEAVLAKDSTLRESYVTFKNLWKDELLKMLQQA